MSKTGKKLGVNKMLPLQENPKVDGDDGDGDGDDVLVVRFLNQLPESLKSKIFIK